MKTLWVLTLASFGVLSLPQGACAQLRQSTPRLAIDADILSVGWTKLVPDEGRTRTQTTLGVGPNQFGASQVALPSAPVGTRRKQGDAQQVRFGGCYSLGAGTMVFLTPSSSVDVGAYFEGRFPDIDEKPEAKISDLRWLVRAGFSLWR